MGWDVELCDENGVVSVPPHNEGGIITLNRDNQYADISVTWNYAPLYFEHIDKEKGFRWLNGKKAKDTITRLQAAIKKLGVNQDPDYWKSTPGNAGHILKIMLGWAKQYPNAEWMIQ